MAKQFFKDLPDTSTPLNASRLNGLLDGEEALGNIVVDSIRSKNFFNQEDYIPTTTNSPDVSVSKITNGIRVSTSSSSGTYRCGRYRVLDITNYAGKTFTLSSNVNVGTSGYGRLAILTCDKSDENRTVIAYVDITSNGVKSVSATMPTTITSTNKYLMIALYANTATAVSANAYVDYKNILLCEGTSTTYSPFENVEGQEIYSKAELKVGTWIDRKPIYRKIITGTKVSGTDFSTSIGDNIDTIITLRGILTPNANSGYRFPIPQYESSSVYTRIQISGSKSTLKLISGTSDYSNGDFIVLFEYTKTTD